MLEYKNVIKKYGSKTAVDQISIAFESGKVYALLGPNGSGKTTLMKMSIGLVKPNQGEIYYNNKPISIESRSDIAYMSTEPYFYSWMTVKDIGRYYADFFRDFSWERYETLIRRMELSMDQKAKSLSSGMMAKLKIAVTMGRNAKVYLLDEPLNGIDLLARDEIIKTILEVIDENVTLIISSHLVDELEKVSDHAVFVKDGKIAASRDIESLRIQENKSVVDLYREIYGHGGMESC